VNSKVVEALEPAEITATVQGNIVCKKVQRIASPYSCHRSFVKHRACSVLYQYLPQDRVPDPDDEFRFREVALVVRHGQLGIFEVDRALDSANDPLRPIKLAVQIANQHRLLVVAHFAPLVLECSNLRMRQQVKHKRTRSAFLVARNE